MLGAFGWGSDGEDKGGAEEEEGEEEEVQDFWDSHSSRANAGGCIGDGWCNCHVSTAFTRGG